MKKPTKPVLAEKPCPPEEPQKEFTEIIYRTPPWEHEDLDEYYPDADKTEVTLEEIFKCFPNGTNLADIKIDIRESNYYPDYPLTYIVASYVKNNEHYEAQLKTYNKKCKKYKAALEQWKEDKKLHKEAMNQWRMDNKKYKLWRAERIKALEDNGEL